MATLAEILINEKLPSEYHITGAIDKKTLGKNLFKLAKERPDLFPAAVKHIKRIGDMFATLEGHSVGLDDITPDYEARNKITDVVEHGFLKAKTEVEKQRLLLDAQAKATELALTHSGNLNKQAKSGARGKPGQLMKTIVSPIVAKGQGDIAQPYLIKHSYAEGLSPGEYWLTAGESRRELAGTSLATALPGETSKIVASILGNVLVTKVDCGTKNGLEYDLGDHQILDRYEAGTDKLITDQYVRSLVAKKKKVIIVRSPLTCLESPGVCQKCYGLNTEGQHLNIGTNIGIRAAQALSEPLTQMVISTKHGGFTAREQKPELIGAFGFRQFVGIPKVYKDEAVLSQRNGIITNIEESPQGGASVYVDGEEHYIPPKRQVSVKKNQEVIKGEMLSDGIPNPKHIVDLQGLGAGRKYMMDTIYDIYKRSNNDADKRNIELLTKQDLNHVVVTKSDTKGKFIKGEIVPYNIARKYISAGAKEENLSSNLIGKKLGDEYLHFTAGTEITPEMYKTFKEKKVKSLLVSNKIAQFAPVMKPVEQIPLLTKDWVAQLGHRHIKDTLMHGAAEAWESSLQGPSPYAPLIYGTKEFGDLMEQGVY